MSSDKPHIPVLRGILCDSHGRYLLLKRSLRSKTWPGLWEFPGGKVDPGEDDVAALRREFVEETGLAVEPAGLFAQFEWPRQDDIVDYRIYFVRASSFSPVISDEHDASGWFSLQELRTLEVSAPLRAIVEKLPAC